MPRNKIKQDFHFTTLKAENAGVMIPLEEIWFDNSWNSC